MSLEETPKSKVAWIPLSQGKFALVDEADAPKALQYGWVAANHGHTFYAKSSEPIKGTRLYLHRFIKGVTDPKIFVDHLDGNGLNNTKANLRLCGAQQNLMNRRPCGRSQLKGVTLRPPQPQIWRGPRVNSAIKLNARCVFLLEKKDTPANRRLAALHYDRAARLLFGEFAWLNFPDVTDYSELAPPNKGLLRLLKLKADMESTYQEVA